MTRVTEALKWVVEINSDYPAMIEIDKVDAKSHLAELATLRAENEKLREALVDITCLIDQDCYAVAVAKEALK